MNIPDINSDSLWKWLAIAGTAVFIASGTAVERQYSDLNKLILDLEVATAIIDVNLELCAINQDRNATTDSFNLSSKLVLQNRLIQDRPSRECSESVRREVAENQARVLAAKQIFRNTRSALMLAGAVGMIGLSSAGVGFLGWRIDQQFESRLKALKVDVMEHELKSKRIVDSAIEPEKTKKIIRAHISHALKRSERKQLTLEKLESYFDGAVPPHIVKATVTQMEEEGLVDISRPYDSSEGGV